MGGVEKISFPKFVCLTPAMRNLDFIYFNFKKKNLVMEFAVFRSLSFRSFSRLLQPQTTS